MSRLSLYLGLILIASGIISYISTGMESITALIPSLFGLVFLLLGLMGQINETWRKHTMHVALLIALLGLGGSVQGLITLIEFITSIDRFAAVITQSIMALSCIYFILAGIRSFLQTRFGRKKNQPKGDDEKGDIGDGSNNHYNPSEDLQRQEGSAN